MIVTACLLPRLFLRGLRLTASCLVSIRESATSGWHWITTHASAAYEVVTRLFFDFVGLFYPQLAAKAEGVWGHITRVWYRWRAEQREVALGGEIEQLQAVGRGLNERIEAQAAEIRLLREANGAGAQADQILQGRLAVVQPELVRLGDEVLVLRRAREELTARAEALGQQLAQEVQAKEAALAASRQFELAHQQDVVRINHLTREAAAALRGVDVLNRLVEALQGPNRERGNGHAELERLIAVYQISRETHCRDLTEAMRELREGDPNRVTIEGIVALSNREGELLARVAGELRYSIELGDPVQRLMAFVAAQRGVKV